MRFVTAVLAAAAFLASALAESGPKITRGDVVVVPLEGEVSAAQFVFLRRVLKESESAGASAFVIEMDTPGGTLDAAVDILHLLMKSEVPTYTWVNTNAGSAGALIALATDAIYMAPVSAIGAAAPVASTGQEIGETMNDKVVSYYSGYFRSAAEKNGYNPELAEAFINKNKVFKMGDVTISPYGSLLTLSAQEAVKRYDGRPLLASGIASDINELKEQAGLHGRTLEVVPSGFERIAQWVTVLAPLFLLGGIIGAYIELKAPGFGVAGIISAVCFITFFAGHYIAGLTGLEVVAVFVLGLFLILIELFFFPGVLILSLTGSALMLGSLLFAMVDYYPGDPVIPDLEMLTRPVLNLGIAMVLAIILIALLARFLPEIPLLRRLMLATSSPTGTSIAVPEFDVYEMPVKPGDLGIARSILRPSGKAEFGATLVDVITDGEYVDRGASVRVREVSGRRVVVEPAGGRA